MSLDEGLMINGKYTGMRFNATGWDQFGPTVSGGGRAPFRCVVLKDFVQPARDGAWSGFSSLRNEVDELTLDDKNNDLFHFRQSADLELLQAAKFPALHQMRDFLATSVREWAERFARIPLDATNVATTVSEYLHTDVLLCHNDELEERRLAFVLYVSPGWLPTDGGTLDLFNSTPANEPTDIAASIAPLENTFVLFEVSATSFHQVAEVLSVGHQRLSINGWFHGGAPLHRPPPTPMPQKPFRAPGFFDDLRSWVNKEYLDSARYRDEFVENSEVQLLNFLQKEKFEAVMAQLRDDKLPFVRVGPANRRCYDVVEESAADAASPLDSCRQLFASEAMFLLLAQLTGLDLHWPPIAAVDDAASSSTKQPSAGRVAGAEPPLLLVTQAAGDAESSSRRRRSASPNPETAASAAAVVSDSSSANAGNGCANAGAAQCAIEVRRFCHRCYTLADDRDLAASTRNFSLDATLFFCAADTEWHESYGGYTWYDAKDEEEPIAIKPAGNSLALVYRDPKTAKFVKYLNHRTTTTPQKKGFCDLSAEYVVAKLTERQRAVASYRLKLVECREVEERLKELRRSDRELQKEHDKTENDIKALQSVGQIVGEILRQLSEDKFVVKAANGPRYVVGCRRTIDKAGLIQGTRVALDMTTLTIMRRLPREVDPLVYKMSHEDPGDVKYSDVGGLAEQIREIREVVELPLLNPELFVRAGTPPKGCLLFGPPGTGKTMLARAVASQLDCNFLKVVSSAIVDKYIGESARMIREMFNYARDHQPCIIFMDEIDAIGGRRFSEGTSADREIQRTLMELLNQMDGFEALGKVKMIMATNRPDTLDPALLRPGRLDRKIEIPLPNEQARLEILKIHAAPITKHGDIDYEAVVKLSDGMSGADLRNVCTEAGLFAIRAERQYVVEEDFMKAVRKVADSKKLETKLDYKPV